MSLHFVLTGSLEKVLPHQEPAPWSYDSCTLPAGDRLSVQLAYMSDFQMIHPLEAKLFFSVKAPDGIRTTLRQVGLVPVRLACTPSHDDDYLTHGPAMLPDVLLPYDEKEGVRMLGGQWRSLWVDLYADQPGDYQVVLSCQNVHGECVWDTTLSLHVNAQALPKQKLIHTEWFHADCIADYYGLEVFSEAHWQVIENQIACAAAHGVNMILTPVVTPALDTAVGGERTTVQLAEIYEKDGIYTFDFSKLDRWLDICQKHGIEHIEICHLFTQWGAKHAPKVMVHTENGLTKRFGWETDALSPAYTVFLHQLLPALKEHLKNRGILQNTWFHISDEPRDEHAQAYLAARNSVLPLLADVHVIDALSSFELYKTGIVPKPVVSNNHIDPFLEANVPDLWTYYCVSQGKDVANRFMAMPSHRNRILGVQLYLYHIEGFLHWGYNFYNAQYSLRHINPFVETDAGEAFPSGDPFLVYPGEDGQTLSSLRLEVLHEALRDLRALEMLESIKGREHVEKLIRDLAGQEITFSSYPRNDTFLYELRKCVNEEIAAEA